MKLITNFGAEDLISYKKAINAFKNIDKSVKFEVRINAYDAFGREIEGNTLALWCNEDHNFKEDVFKVLYGILCIFRENKKS